MAVGMVALTRTFCVLPSIADALLAANIAPFAAMYVLV